jgi:hypothetical protein
MGNGVVTPLTNQAYSKHGNPDVTQSQMELYPSYENLATMLWKSWKLVL